MAIEATKAAGGLLNPWRVFGWGTAVALLLLPALSGAPWTHSDYIFAGALLAVTGSLCELGVRVSRDKYYRAGFALALLAALLTVWVNLAVGIVGSDDNPPNLLFFGALLAGGFIAGAARMRPRGMAIAMTVTAMLIVAAFALAVAQPTDEPFVNHWRELAGTGLFAGLFAASAALFRRAAARA